MRHLGQALGLERRERVSNTKPQDMHFAGSMTKRCLAPFKERRRCSKCGMTSLSRMCRTVDRSCAVRDSLRKTSNISCRMVLDAVGLLGDACIAFVRSALFSIYIYVDELSLPTAAVPLIHTPHGPGPVSLHAAGSYPLAICLSSRLLDYTPIDRWETLLCFLWAATADMLMCVM